MRIDILLIDFIILSKLAFYYDFVWILIINELILHRSFFQSEKSLFNRTTDTAFNESKIQENVCI